MNAHPEISAFWQSVPHTFDQVTELLAQRYGATVTVTFTSRRGQLPSTGVFLHVGGSCVSAPTLIEAMAEIERVRARDAKSQAAQLREEAAELRSEVDDMIERAHQKLKKAKALEAGA